MRATSVAAAMAVLTGVGAGAVAVASGSGSEQFGGRAHVVSNRLLAAPNTGPSGDGNSGALLLRLPGFGDFIVNRCTFSNGVDNEAIGFRNTSGIPIDVIGTSAFGRSPTFAPGESSTILFLGGAGAPSHLLLAGGDGLQRRVASVDLATLFENNACSFDIQATPQFAHR
jgi:hypothetical protein